MNGSAFSIEPGNSVQEQLKIHSVYAGVFVFALLLFMIIAAKSSYDHMQGSFPFIDQIESISDERFVSLAFLPAAIGTPVKLRRDTRVFP